jgi:hypothetical protein
MVPTFGGLANIDPKLKFVVLRVPPIHIPTQNGKMKILLSESNRRTNLTALLLHIVNPLWWIRSQMSYCDTKFLRNICPFCSCIYDRSG